MKYKLIYKDDCNSERTIRTFATFESAVEEGCAYIEDERDTYGDSRENILESLRTRSYYIIGYGPESVEIVEEDDSLSNKITKFFN